LKHILGIFTVAQYEKGVSIHLSFVLAKEGLESWNITALPILHQLPT
jgi:hypothetical protein